MANDTSTDLTTLDFDSIKQNLKEYLKSQKIFKDYDFEGSNINVLLDVLAHNTHLNTFYLNMIGNEMFLDSALLQDSVVSHAKELNYLPRSFRSAVANVNITMTGTNSAAILIPRGTSFTGTSRDKSFTFTTAENINVGGSDNVFVANNVLLYEGDYTYDSFVVNNQDPQRYKITNRTVDTNSVLVTVIEDNGSNVLTYKKADSLFGLDSTSQVFFIQAAEDQTYEIVFGDGVVGRRPKDRSIVTIEYRKSNGELPNGIRQFTADDDIDSATVTKVDVNSPATGGSIPETLESIRFNAPRAFTTQERVVTAKDYETLLQQNFSDINAVSAYGGEEAVPPQYGKVIVAVDLKTTDELPPSRRVAYSKFIKPRSPLSIDPVFVAPDYTYVQVKSKVKYNINETSLSVNDIQTIVKSTIQDFNNDSLNGFNKTLYYSNLVSGIDRAQGSIISNDTELFAIKTFEPTPRRSQNYDIDFGMEMNDIIGELARTRPSSEISVVRSSPFIFAGRESFLEDNGDGIMRIMTNETNEQTVRRFVKNIGTVDYDKGVIQLEQFAPQELFSSELSLYARTRDRDIKSQRRTILAIRDQDIDVSIEQVRGR